MLHRWSDPDYSDINNTVRRCTRVGCTMLKITRHEPDNYMQPHWLVWDRQDGRGQFNSEHVPECTGAAAPKKERKVVAKAAAPKKTAEAPKDDHPYRLVAMRVENFRKLKAVHVTPTGAIVKVSGRNEQGKSALLDSVYAAIGGKKFFPATPVREGEERAEIMLDFGGLKLTRTIWNKEGGGVDHKVVLQYADGKRPKQAQDVLNELLGSPIADDPLAFSKMKSKEQYELLKKLVPGIDFDAHEEKRKELYERRTQVGRDRDRAAGAADSIEVPVGAKEETVDVTELASELGKVGAFNAEIERRREAREQAAEKISNNLDEIDRLEATIKQLKTDTAALEIKLKNAEPLPEPMDAEAIEQQIADADAINAGARALSDRKAKIKERDEAEKLYAELSNEIDDMDKDKRDAIAEAKLPVKGLDFGDDEILLDGLPFSDASTARKIRTATALLMAMKPELRVLLVREGSLLDDDARDALEADAKEHGFVVLMECVGTGDASGIVIEDGEVV
jgi:hypothetical protein